MEIRECFTVLLVKIDFMVYVFLNLIARNMPAEDPRMAAARSPGLNVPGMIPGSCRNSRPRTSNGMEASHRYLIQ